jgi:hypothetical protein
LSTKARYFLAGFILLLSTGLLKGQSVFPHAQTQVAYQQVLSFSEPFTEEGLKNLLKSEQDFVRIQHHWWATLRGESSEQHFAAIRKIAEGYIQENRRPQNLSCLELFMTTMAHGFSARIELLEGSRFSAANEYLEGIKYLKALREKEETYEETSLLLSLYDGIVGAAEEHVLYTPILFFFPKGDLQKGLKELKALSSKENPIVATEALYFRYKIYSSLLEKPAEARWLLQQLMVKYPNNWLFRFELLRVQLAQNPENKQQLFNRFQKDLAGLSWLKAGEKQYIQYLLLELKKKV